MSAVAERHLFGVLAGAPGNGLGFGNRNFFRLEARSFMRPIAEGLAL